MITGRLKIDGGVLSDGLAAINRSIEEFEHANDQGNAAADACGHGGLGGALRNASSSWELRRVKVLAALRGLAKAMDTTIKNFGDVDDQFAKAFRGDGGSGQQPAPSASSGGGTPSPGGSSASGGSSAGGTSPGSQPAPIRSEPDWQPGGDGAPGGQSTAPEGPRPDPILAGPGPEPVPWQPAPIDPLPEHPVAPLPSPIPLPVPGGGGTGTMTPEAELLVTIARLWDNWTKLGGSKEAMVAAMTVLGLSGLLLKLGLVPDPKAPPAAGSDPKAGPAAPGPGAEPIGTPTPAPAEPTPE